MIDPIIGFDIVGEQDLLWSMVQEHYGRSTINFVYADLFERSSDRHVDVARSDVAGQGIKKGKIERCTFQCFLERFTSERPSACSRYLWRSLRTGSHRSCLPTPG